MLQRTDMFGHWPRVLDPNAQWPFWASALCIASASGFLWCVLFGVVAWGAGR
jgi:hypothetical protein